MYSGEGRKVLKKLNVCGFFQKGIPAVKTDLKGNLFEMCTVYLETCNVF